MSDRPGPTVLPLPIPGLTPVPIPPSPERFRLENGLRVAAIHRHGLPQIAVRLVIPAGSIGDPEDQPGTASFVGSLLKEGTHRRSAIELNEALDDLGASLDVRVGHDFTEIDLALLSETLEEGLPILAEILEGASFPEREVERARAEILDALTGRLDEPANVADDRAAEGVFGGEHPYGRLPLGTPEGVRRVRRRSLVEFHRRRYRPDGAVLIMGGDLPTSELRGFLNETFAGWTGAADSLAYPAWPRRGGEAGSLARVPWEDAAQGEIRFAGLGMHRRSPDWIPAAVANYILGGSTITGRLGANLREDKGWTYGIRSGFASGVHPGGWVVETAVDAEFIDDALNEIEEEIRRIGTDPVEEEELSRAREALILSLPRAFETPSRIVARIATIEAFGLEADYWHRFPDRVREVTAEDVMRICREHFDPGSLVRVAVGPFGGPD